MFGPCFVVHYCCFLFCNHRAREDSAGFSTSIVLMPF